MRSKAIVIEAMQRSRKVSAWLFGAVFSLEAAPVLSAFFVSITKKPLNAAFSSMLTALPLIVAMLLFTVYLRKRGRASGVLAGEPVGKKLQVLAGAVFSFLIVLILMILAWQAFSSLYVLTARYAVSQPGLAIPAYAVLVLVVLVFTLLLQAGLAAFFTFGLVPQALMAYPRHFLSMLILLFRRIPVALTMLAALLAGVLLFRLLDNQIVRLLDTVFYDSLASRLVYILLAAALETFIINFLIRLSEGLFASAGTRNSQPGPGGKGTSLLKTLIPLAAAAVLLIALAWSLLPGYGSAPADEYQGAILTHLELGDLMTADPDQLDLSSYNYRKAYSLVMSFQGYIKTILASQDASRGSLRMEAGRDFDAAAAYDVTNPYYFLFRGNWFEAGGNKLDALRMYRISRDILPALADAGFACCRLEAASGDSKSLQGSIDAIINMGRYRVSFEQYKTLAPQKLEKLLEDYEKTRSYLFERLAISALEKYRSNDVKGMYDDISIMLKAEPDSPNLILLQAIASMAYRPEAYNYPVADAALKKLAGLVPENVDVQEFYGRMLLTSKNYEQAAGFFKTLYAKYPDNIALGEQYVYALLAGSKADEALEICDGILEAYPKDWLCHYIKAIALLKSGHFSESLDSMLDFLETSDAEEYRISHDSFLNACCLAYSLTTMKPEAMAALDKLPSGSLLRSYILGITAWRDRDLPKALALMNTVLERDPALGLAWFTKASILFEQSMTDSGISRTELEAVFTKAAALQPGSIEVWFSLGNFYKAWTGHEAQALRAYRRVVDLEPNSDHSHDYYGVVYHAYLEIDQLEANEWQQKGG